MGRRRKAKRVLVTGGAGFIGSHLVESLLERDCEVRVLDNFATGKRENLSRVADRIELIEGDASNPETAARAVESVAQVFHQAALPGVQPSIKDPVSCHRANVTGTLIMLSAAREAGVGIFVFASSSSVYGDSPTLPKREDMAPSPISPYAAAKLAAERYCQIFSSVYGLPAIALRYFNVFGPRQDPSSEYAAVIPKFIGAMLRGERPTIYGDGEQSRDFTFVEDAVAANLLAASKPDLAGKVFNIARGSSVTINELFTSLRNYLALEMRPRYADPLPGDVRHSLADIRAAEALLRYKPKVTFEEGLRRTVEYLREELGRV